MSTQTIPSLDGVGGRVIRPDDSEYDKARTSFYGGVDRRPAAIVRVADANDVSRVISLVRESGTEFVVRSGGHGVAGYALPNDGIVLDLRDMRALDIDAERRTAWAETGLTAAEYTTAADAVGLATGFGDTGSVGLGGLTPGGGVGYFVRQHGLTIHDLGAAYIGTPGGERAGGPFGGLATRIVDMVKPSRYPEMSPPDDPNYHPIATGRTLFIDSVDRDVADVIVGHLGGTDALMRVAQLRVLGGAMARVPVEATAFAHRKSRIMVNVASLCELPDQAPEYEAWVTGFAAALKQGDSGAYVNFLVDEGEARIRDAYPGKTWDRLRSIKTRYDPTNLFRLNQNTPPITKEK